MCSSDRTDSRLRRRSASVFEAHVEVAVVVVDRDAVELADSPSEYS
jgi:hypothetical protein